MHVRIAREAVRGGVHELLEYLLLGFAIERPESPVLALAKREAEEVLQATVRNKRVALDVKEDVALRRFGKQREAAAGLDVEVLPVGSALAAAGELDAGLLARAGERLGAAASRLPRERKRDVREALQRGDVPIGELAPLEPCDSGDESEMVGVVALLVAAFPEGAGVALLDGLGHRQR